MARSLRVGYPTQPSRWHTRTSPTTIIAFHFVILPLHNPPPLLTSAPPISPPPPTPVRSRAIDALSLAASAELRERPPLLTPPPESRTPPFPAYPSPSCVLCACSHAVHPAPAPRPLPASTAPTHRTLRTLATLLRPPLPLPACPPSQATPRHHLRYPLAPPLSVFHTKAQRTRGESRVEGSRVKSGVCASSAAPPSPPIRCLFFI